MLLKRRYFTVFSLAIVGLVVRPTLSFFGLRPAIRFDEVLGSYGLLVAK